VTDSSGSHRFRAGLARLTAAAALSLGLSAALLSSACSSGEGPPDFDAEGMEPQVVELLSSARADVQAEPANAEKWGRLGAAFDVHGLFDEAERCYRKARELDPDAFRWAYFLAIVRDVQGADPDELVALFRTAVELRPDYAQAQFRLGYALGLRGATDEAEAAYREAIRLDPNLAMAQRDLAQLLLARGEVRPAVEVLLAAAEIAPWDGAIFSTLAQGFERAGNPELAAKAAARASRLEPATEIRDPELAYVAELGCSSMHWVTRARRQIDAEDFDGALESLEQLRRILPDDAQTFYLSGAIQWRMAQRQEALASLARAVELDPNHVEARREYARVLAAENRMDEAAAQLESARALEPDNVGILLTLAQTLAQGDDDAGAEAVYADLDRLDAHDARTLSNWGNVLGRLGRDEEALAKLQLALLFAPDFANAHFNVALVLERLGRTDEAVEHLREAVRLEPGHTAAADELARLGES
jgi:tetratricopeptide (TPR) repeat protein